MNIYDILNLQPTLRKAYNDYCADDDDEKFDAALSVYGLVRDEDGNIHDI